MEDVEVAEENLLPNVSGLKVNKQHHLLHHVNVCYCVQPLFCIQYIFSVNKQHHLLL